MKLFPLIALIITAGCGYPNCQLQKLDKLEFENKQSKHLEDYIRPEEALEKDNILDILRYTQNLKQVNDRDDYWQYPKETIQKGGDCEDKTFLMLSMLIKAGIKEACGVKGRYFGQGHMWVEYNGYIMDPSRKNTGLIPIKKSTGYVPYFKFDKENVYFCDTGKETQ